MIKTSSSSGEKRKRIIARWILPYLADNVFSHIFIGPLTTLFWRGAWEVLNRNLVPDQPKLGAWICFAVGNVGIVGLALSQNLWTKHMRVEKTCSMRWMVGYHLYTYVLGVLNVFHWRGVWELLDRYTGINGISCLVTLAIGQCTLLLLRCSMSIVAPPLVVDMDTDPEFFHHPGRFQSKFVVSVTGVLDSIFAVVVIHQLTVFYWRGLWEVFDVYVFPDNVHASAVTCILVALTLHVLLCFLQPVFNHLYRSSEQSKHRKIWQWLLEAVIYFVGNPVCVTQWRGVWLLCNQYFNPSHSDRIDIILHLLGVGLLMMFSCGQSVTARGCPIEGDASVEDGCIFQNKYFRYFMERRDRARTERQQEQQLQEEQKLHEDQKQQKDQKMKEDLLESIAENKTNGLLSNGDSTSVMITTVL